MKMIGAGFLFFQLVLVSSHTQVLYNPSIIWIALFLDGK